MEGLDDVLSCGRVPGVDHLERIVEQASDAAVAVSPSRFRTIDQFLVRVRVRAIAIEFVFNLCEAFIESRFTGFLVERV